MPSFSYRAVGKNGKEQAGVLTAESYLVALRMLEEQGALSDPGQRWAVGQKMPLVRGRRVKRADLTTFYSQLADLLRGVPILRALDVLSGKGSRGTLAQMVKELREDVAGGQPLGEAMAKHPRVFSPLHSSMVRAGEQGGFLEDVLHRISIFLEKQDELRNKVRGAMIYPSILVLLRIGRAHFHHGVRGTQAPLVPSPGVLQPF